MKILRVINSLDVGGAERSIASNIILHKKNGFDMDVLLLDGKSTIFLDKLKDNNIKVISLGDNINIYNPLLIFKMIKYIKMYDLIHVHLFPSFYWVAIAKLLSFSKVLLVYTEHSTQNRRIHIPIFKYIDRFVYNKYSKIISISEATTKMLIEYLNQSNNIVTIPNGVDFDEFKNISNLNKSYLFSIPDDKFVLIQVAGFRKAKDQDTVIKTMQLLPKQIHLVLVGDGERLDICKNLVHDMKLDHRVTFLGIRNDIPNLINASDVVIMSSHYEGFGRAVVEGMYMSKPIIASNVPGMADIVRNNGMLFEVGDCKQLAENILNIFSDNFLYSKFSELSKIKSREFDVKYMISGYESIYLDLLKDKL